MRRVFQPICFALIGIALLVCGPATVVRAQSLDDLESSWERISKQHETLRQRIDELEVEYEALNDEIDRIKREGTEGLPERISLESRLERSRELATRLEKLQKRRRRIGARLEQLRRQILARTDEEMSRLEDELRRAPAERRPELVERLNALGEVKRTYREPLPERPDEREVRQTLEMAERVGSDHPDRMLAAADEIEDTEDQIRRRLTALERKLRELRDAKMLTRRAESFASEERFFDEGRRPRLAGRYTSGDGDSNEGDQPEAQPGDETGESAPSSGDDGSLDQGDSRAGAPGSGARNSDSDYADEGSTGEVPAGVDDSAGANNDYGSSGEEELFGSDSFVLEETADPEDSVSATFADDDLESRIEALEEEREQLEARAEELDDKAKNLRDKAHEMRSFDDSSGE